MLSLSRCMVGGRHSLTRQAEIIGQGLFSC